MKKIKTFTQPLEGRGFQSFCKFKFFLAGIAHMSWGFEKRGYVFTTLLKYKQKYKDAEFEFTNSIPRSYVKKNTRCSKTWYPW